MISKSYISLNVRGPKIAVVFDSLPSAKNCAALAVSIKSPLPLSCFRLGYFWAKEPLHCFKF